MHKFILLGALSLSFYGSMSYAHMPYEELTDPVTGQDCCGDEDCNILVIEPGVLQAVETGYLVTLTGEQASRINPRRTYAVQFIVP